MVSIQFTAADALKAFSQVRVIMAEAATAAMVDVAEQVMEQGRRDIASAGFSKRWQNALSYRVYPEGRASTTPAAFIYHNIPYAGVFETGAVIEGAPFLWVPTREAKQLLGFGGALISPRRFAQRYGALRSVRFKNGGNRNPMLVGKIGGKWVPVFVGVKRVSVGRKFHILEIADKARQRIPEFYAKHLRDEG